GNLADQTLKEFQQYVSPYNNFKFSEEYIVQRLQGNQIDTTARVCICTIQRMYSMLKGRDLPADLEEVSVGAALAAISTPEPIESFEQFIADHKDEITALQILYAKPYKQRLTFEAVKELADAIEKPPYLWNESQLWQAYAALEASKVKGASGRRILTDLVSLVRFAIHQDNELVPFPERVNANFKAWLATQDRHPGESRGPEESRGFTPEQMKWLEMIRDHIAANLGIEPDDFEYAPFAQEGGPGKIHQLFGDKLPEMLASLNPSTNKNASSRKSKNNSPASTKPSPTSSASRPTSSATKPPSSKPPSKAASSKPKPNSPAAKAAATKLAPNSCNASSKPAAASGKTRENTKNPPRPTPPTCSNCRRGDLPGRDGRVGCLRRSGHPDHRPQEN
ncbi:MAG: type I restriction-modification enzyme R subunit C-terminal domain-containing protein, partial [Thiobacillus sp.]|nr:type I restriction-modification enzyme R subunit C-terminal domain-containing protein [Thiobacillus sp.]